MSEQVLVGCRLPSGLVLDGSAGTPITINGTNTAMLEGAPGLTHVDSVEWMYLQQHYATHSAFTSGGVFSFKESEKVADVLAIADDLKGEKTGFEGIDPNKPAAGLEPEDPTKLKTALDKAASTKVPAKVPKSAKDKAAAVQAAVGE